VFRRFTSLLAALTVILSTVGPVYALESTSDADATTRWSASDLEAATADQEVENPFKDATEGIFLIRFDGAPLATYRGGIVGLEATSPVVTGDAKLDVASPQAVAYTAHLEAAQAAMVDRIERTIDRVLDVRFRYTNSNNGVAAWLTPAEAARVAKMPGVAFVQPDLERELHTDSGPAWIGAPGIWSNPDCDEGNGCGEGVIVGVIDSGINPANPSFADVGLDGYDHTNPLGAGNYVGVCDPANAGDDEVKPYDPDFACNDKLIGAWGFTSVDGQFPGDSPFDNDGHGSHTASTAAGNFVEATVTGNDAGAPGGPIEETLIISGVAPHANIIAYAGCCTLSGLTASIDQAIADGVDVINYSIGSPSASNVWNDFDTVGFLSAREAGIFVATSAGNEGPGAETVGSPADAPWLTSVGASTHDRLYTNDLVNLTGGDTAPPADITGKGFTVGFGPAPIVYAGDYPSDLTDTPELCGVGTLGDYVSPWPADTFDGEIVVCDRGTFGRTEKGANALASGAGGFVLINDEGNGNSLVGDAHDLPGVHVSYDDGIPLKTWLATGAGHTATITGATSVEDEALGDIMAGFSSRGANRAIDIISPNVVAPGVDIIAAAGTDNAVVWDFNSGTSMASPHVAGAAALLVQQQPDWTPAQIQSALMMTATRDVLKEDGATAADPFDMGSGRIRLVPANRSTLVLDESVANYLAADPAEGGDPTTINIPSMANSQCVLECSWTRTVEATVPGTWTVSVADGDGVDLSVSVDEFTLAAGETQELTITADVIDAEPGSWIFGEIELSHNFGPAPEARMPVAVIPSRGVVPRLVEMETRRDAGSWPVDGLTSLEITDFSGVVDGMVIGTQVDEILAADSDNSSPYDDPTDGAFTTLVTVGAGASELIAETIFSESPDLDLFVGFDANEDGIAQESEEVCFSATGSALEYCSIADPQAGDWWILVQNWDGSEADALTLSYAILDGTNAGNMTVEGPATNPQLEPFGIRIFWDDTALETGDKAYATVSLGTDGAEPGNIGSFPVELVRRADDVTKTADTRFALPYDTITYEIAIQPNVTPENLTYTLSDVLPDGVTYVESSATNGATVVDGVLEWTGELESPFLADQFFVQTTSATDPMCDTGFGGYVDLEAFGIFVDPTISGDTVAFSAFGGQNPVNFYGTEHTGFGFSDDGFAYFTGGYGGEPWVSQTLPDSAAPNNVAAGMWADFEIFGDAVANDGVSLATAGPDLSVLEYDGLQLFGGSDPVLDMNIVVASLDDTPGFYEVVFAYDNIDSDLLGVATIGVENADGSEALTLVNNGDAAATVSDGFQVCYDWRGPSFEPTVISYQVTVDADNPGERVFNEVTHDTDDPGSEPVTVSTRVKLVAGISTVLDEALALTADLVAATGGTTQDKAEAALDRLIYAANPRLWEADGVRLVTPEGVRALKRMRRAIYHLEQIGEASRVFDDAQVIIWSIADATENIAEVALADAILGNADPDAIAEAQEWYDKGVRAYNNGAARRAALRFQKSWEAATR
jgi:uncharacterized repeat protein (TIGR01451 family)